MRQYVTNVHDILIPWKKVNKTLKIGRKYISLRKNLQFIFLEKNKLSKSFWRNWKLKILASALEKGGWNKREEGLEHFLKLNKVGGVRINREDWELLENIIARLG